MDVIRERAVCSYMWGCNRFGQLGLGHTEDVLVPTGVLLCTPDVGGNTCKLVNRVYYFVSLINFVS
jgi:hypothetical protein